jgi:hypothetical protein
MKAKSCLQDSGNESRHSDLEPLRALGCGGLCRNFPYLRNRTLTFAPACTSAKGALIVNFSRTRLLTASVTLHHRTCAQNQRSNPASVARASAVAPQHVHWLRSYCADRIEERFGVSDIDSLDPLGVAEAGGATQFRAWASAGVGVLVDHRRPAWGSAFAVGSEPGPKALDHRPLVTRRAVARMPACPKSRHFSKPFTVA